MSRVEHQLSRVSADRYLTVEEASEQLGVKANVIRNYLYKGKLKTYKFKALTLLSATEVRDWRGRNR